MKINSRYLNNLMDVYLGRFFVWVNNNRLRVFFFVFVVFIWSTFSWLPYFNLIFIKELVAFLVLASLFLIFRVGWKTILYFCFGLFIISGLFDLLGLLTLSELIGNYIYGFMVLIVIKFVSSV